MKIHFLPILRNTKAAAVLALIGGLAANAAEVVVSDAFSHPTLKNGLLAWYDFDGNFSDANGALNAKVANGSPGFGEDRFGNKRGAFQTSGGDAVSADGITIGGGSFAIQFWALNPTNWFLGQGVRSNYHGLHIGVDGTGMRCDYWGSSLSAPLGERPGWAHWVITHDAASHLKTIWRDGQCVAQATAPPYSGKGPFIIGRHFLGGGYFSGNLDDLAIWNRALTTAEIADLYADGKGLVYRVYPGVPYHDARYHGGPQVIPGILQNEYYDTMDIPDAQKAAGAEEEIVYHDTDNVNSGSATFNGKGSYNKEFRMYESPDISYTKFNNPGTLVDDSPFTIVKPEPDSLYLGWIAPGEWVKYTVDVQTEGDYTLNILFTSKFGGHISFDSDGVDVTGPLTIPSTFNAKDPIDWRQAHHWNKVNHLGKFHLKNGRQVLKLHFIDQPVMNFDYMEFVLLK